VSMIFFNCRVGCVLLPTNWSPREPRQPPMIHVVAGRPRADPVRLCVARCRRRLVATRRPHRQRITPPCRGSDPLLGQIASINVSWPPTMTCPIEER
jgi:hypothetical protein